MSTRKRITVTEMKNGQTGRVFFINGGMGIHAKLEALGIRQGVNIVKKSSFMGKGPVVVSVGTGEVAIGYGMASNIFVEVEE